jgi:hypothetical protein
VLLLSGRFFVAEETRKILLPYCRKSGQFSATLSKEENVSGQTVSMNEKDVMILER